MTTSETLSSLLSEMVPVLDELIGLSEKKQDVLVRGDAPELERLIALEMNLIVTLDQLERERIQLHESTDSSFQDPEVHSAASSVKDRLSLLKRLNDTNLALVRTSLRVIRHGLKVLLPQASGYEGATMAGSLVFDRKS